MSIYGRAIAILISAFLIGCGASSDSQSTEAVRKSIVDYLAKRGDLNMEQMNVEVASVSFREDEADVTVSIQLKGGTPDQGMRMSYTLERQNGDWVVKDKRGQGGTENPHGGAAPSGPLPSGHPPAPTGEIPSGHPPVNPGSSQ